MDSSILISKKMREMALKNDAKIENILELGCGPKLTFSKVIRSAFPDSYITAYDKFKKRIKKSDFDIISELRLHDITSERVERNFKSEIESYDLTVFGSYRVDPGFHFGFLSRETIESVILTMDKYLKKGGIFFCVTKSKKHENIREKNYIDASLMVREFNGHLNYDSVSDEIFDVLEKSGKYKLIKETIKDIEEVDMERKVLPDAMLKLQLDKELITQEEYDEKYDAAIKLTEKINEHGLEYGHINIITGYKL